MDDADGRLGWMTRMEDSDGRLGWRVDTDGEVTRMRMTRMDSVAPMERVEGTTRMKGDPDGGCDSDGVLE